MVLAKLVKKILSGEFINMAKLLKDNMEIEWRRHPAEGESGSSIGGMGKREIPDMLSWLHCFSLYAAVVSSKYPHKAREFWAYQALCRSILGVEVGGGSCTTAPFDSRCDRWKRRTSPR